MTSARLLHDDSEDFLRVIDLGLKELALHEPFVDVLVRDKRTDPAPPESETRSNYRAPYVEDGSRSTDSISRTFRYGNFIVFSLMSLG